jgi:uncharacterized membrane protein (DUF485 family)
MLDQRREALRPQVRVMQIIVAAMAMGVITFGVIVLAVIVKPEQLQPIAGPVTYAAIALAITSLGMSVVLPRIIVATARRKIAQGNWQPPPQHTAAAEALTELGVDGQLVMVYQTAMIIGAALLEGPAFVGLIATIIEKSSLGLGVSAVCLMLLLARFPTIGRLENWLDGQRRALEADRMQ